MSNKNDRPSPHDVARLHNGETTSPQGLDWITDWIVKDEEVARWYDLLDIDALIEPPTVAADDAELARLKKFTRQTYRQLASSRIVAMPLGRAERNDLILRDQAVSVKQGKLDFEFQPLTEPGEFAVEIEGLHEGEVPLGITVADLGLSDRSAPVKGVTWQGRLYWPEEVYRQYANAMVGMNKAQLLGQDSEQKEEESHVLALACSAESEQATKQPQLQIVETGDEETGVSFGLRLVNPTRGTELLVAEVEYGNDEGIVRRKFPILLETPSESDLPCKEAWQVPLPMPIPNRPEPSICDNCAVTLNLRTATQDDLALLEPELASQFLGCYELTALPLTREQGNRFRFRVLEKQHAAVLAEETTWMLRYATSMREVGV